MKPVDDKKETVTIRAVSKDEEGQKQVQKMEVSTHNIESMKHIEKKLVDNGVHRQERQPTGLNPKSGHGGKYTWEGPGDIIHNELDPAPPAMDENDPNYVDEEAEQRIVRGEVSGLSQYVVGEVDVPKLLHEGVARIHVDPHLQTN